MSPKVVNKADVSIGYHGYGGAVETVYLSEEQTCHILCVACHMAGDVVSHLRQAIHNDKDGVESLGRRQVRDKIDGYMLPCPLWYWQWLQQSLMLVPIRFYPTAGAAVSNVLPHVGIHAFPAVLTRQQLEGLRSSWVAGGGVVVVLPDNFGPEVVVFWNIYLISIEEESIFCFALCQLQKWVAVPLLFNCR